VAKEIRGHVIANETGEGMFGEEMCRDGLWLGLFINALYVGPWRDCKDEVSKIILLQ